MTDSPENGSAPETPSQPVADPAPAAAAEPAAAAAAEPASAADPAPAVASSTAPAQPDPLEVAKAEAAKLKDQLLRTAADFENYRRRSRREVDDAQKKGSEELLRALLPVFDNLERAVVHAEQSTDAKAIAEGVKMVLKQFTDSLGRAGIKRVAGVGQPFDPLLHEAIQQVETDDQPSGTVVAEVQPGYSFGDRLVRAAMVVVARPRAKPSAPPEEPAS
jgi:molecular chaperone GrpE